MCGRFALLHPREALEELFALTGIEPYPPRYNIAPTQPVLAITPVERPEGSNLPKRKATLMRWGLLPSWVKDTQGFPVLFNARSETAAEKASFRAAMRHRRCIIPASGFYEWRRDKASGQSQAYWARPADGQLIGFAGLHETYISKDGSEIDTCTIMTTAAQGGLAKIHVRAPVALRPEHYDRWLDVRGFEPRDVADLMTPSAQDLFEPIPVSDLVNKVANSGPDLLTPVEPRTFETGKVAKGADPGEDIQPSLF